MRSHLGGRGPAFERGLTPAALGWGDDAAAHPDRCAVNPVDGAEMVWVPPGRFTMGSTQGEIDRVWSDAGWDAETKWLTRDEQPAHEVEFAHGFWLYRHQVTSSQYARFLQATGHEAPDGWDAYRQHGALPVVNVTWHDAQQYARYAAGALPTEARWEWAARGPERRSFPWGDRWDRNLCWCAERWAERALNDDRSWDAWYRGIGAARHQGGWSLATRQNLAHLQPVGGLPAGAGWCGALDLAGNVWEWCADWYAEDYYAVAAGREPAGPASGADRVVRGGAWDSAARDCRAAGRNSDDPERGHGNLGFRLVVI